MAKSRAKKRRTAASSSKSQQQKLPRAHSLLDLYNGIRHSPRVAPITIEDPYRITANHLAAPVARPRGAVTKDGPLEVAGTRNASPAGPGGRP